jgi:hypothetical protein
MTLPESKRARIPAGFDAAFSAFQAIPNVGRATAEDLVRLRVRSVPDLARRDPLTLYRRLCKLDGSRHDPCVIDVFMAAVAFANTGTRRSWWKYTPARKKMLAAMVRPGAKRVSRSKR